MRIAARDKAESYAKRTAKPHKRDEHSRSTREQARTWLWPAAVFGLALAVRLVYLAQSAANPTFATPVMDSYDYDDLARALLDGHAPHTPLLWQPALYPVFLAGVYKLFGGSIVAARLLQVVVGASTCTLTCLLGTRLLGRRGGVIAGTLAALYGPLIFYDADLTATGWAAFLAAALVLLAIITAQTRNWLAGATCGVCAALSILARPTFVPVVTAVAIWLALTGRTRGIARTVLAPLTGFVIVVCALAGWSWPRTGHCGLLPACGGINFYIGNSHSAEETTAARPGRDWRALEDLPAQHGVRGDMWDQQRFYYREAAADILQAPFGFVRGLATKAVEFFCSRELPRSEDLYVFRRWSPVLGLLVWKEGAFGFPFGVLLPLAVIGHVHSRRLMPGPVWAMLILYPAAIILVFNAARYRVPLVPVMAVPAAAGVLLILDAARNRRWAGLGVCAASAVLLIAASTIPGPFRTEQIDYDGELHLLVGNRYAHEQKLAPAIEQFETGLRFDAENSDLHANLATALATIGRVDAAIEHYAAAVRLRPGSAVNHARYGLALFQRGDLEGAMTQYRRAVELEPSYGKAWSQLGVALERSGRAAEAVDAYRRAAEASPNEVIIRYNLGAALARGGDLEGAISELRAAVMLDPEYSDARYDLARTLHQLGRSDQALAEARELLHRKPDHQGARQLLSRLSTDERRAP